MRVLFVGLISAALLGLAARGSGQPPAQVDYEALARSVAAEIAARQFDKVAARFDARMAQALSAEKLAAGWDSLLAQAGAFQSVKAATQEELQGLRIVHLICSFERAELELRVVFDAQSHIAGLAFLPAQASAPWSPPSYASSSLFHERAVTVGSAPWQLPGTLTVPSGAGPFPGVVLVHGSGPNDQDETLGPNKPFKDLAWGLASRGIAVLRYTKRTRFYGKQMMALPGGITVNEETVDDARAGVTLLVAQPEIDPHRVFLLGHSLGAYLGPRITAGDSQVAGLILMAGSTRPMEDLVVEQVRYLASLNGKITPEGQKQIEAAEASAKEWRNPDLKPGTTVHLLGVPVPASYVLDLRNYHPAEMAASLPVPMLILQGERDYQVRGADFDGWKKVLGNKANVQFKLYPALNHLFMPGTGPSSEAEYLKPNHVADGVVGDIAAWIKAQAPGGATRPKASPSK